MSRALPHFALFLVLSFGAAFPAAAAQSDPSSEVWDQPHEEDLLLVTNNTTLTIRGTTVGLATGFRVDPGSRLILESTSDAPARFEASDADGYDALVLGTLELRGLPGWPVVIDGAGGEASMQEGFVIVSGGLDVAGVLTASHALVTNYTAGIRLVLPAARVDLRDVRFSSERGVGLMAAAGAANVTGASFEGAGATVWMSAPANLFVGNASFTSSETPISVTGGSARFENVTVGGNVTRCLQAASGEIAIHRFTCVGYSENGMQLTRSRQGIPAKLEAEALEMRSQEPGAGAAINALRVPDLVLRNSTIGPLLRNGIRLEASEAELENVRFQGVGEYNVFLLDAPSPPPYKRMGEGDPGGAGWLLASGTAQARILMPDLTPAAGAGLAYARESNRSVVSTEVADADGRSKAVVLETYRIGPDGRSHQEEYEVIAQDAHGYTRWQRDSYVPDGNALSILLKEPGPAPRATPFPALLALAALLLVALRRRA